MISITYSTKCEHDRVLAPHTKLSPHVAPPQPPPAPKRSHIVPITHTHPIADYEATPLLREVGGGCHSQGGVLPHPFGGVDLHMDTIRSSPASAPPCLTPTRLLIKNLYPMLFSVLYTGKHTFGGCGLPPMASSMSNLYPTTHSPAGLGLSS